MKSLCAVLIVVCLCFVGCKNDATPEGKGPPQSFSLAVSEYPSWSVFLVAEQKGMIDGKKGKQGPLETKWNVDLVLHEADYDTCIQMLAANQADFACVTNMDSLAPALGRPLVAILPTSTSDGADACIVVGDIKTIDDLKDKEVRGLEKSVSQYTFERNLELDGKNPRDFVFKNMDPAAAAQAVQTNQANIEAIVVWNPFVLQTLRTRDGAKVLFDSSTIPEEIIDCVVGGKDSLQKSGGSDAAACIVDAFYSVNDALASTDKEEADKTLVAIGAKFSSLGLEDMRTVVKQTRFYSTPTAGTTLFTSQKFRETTTPQVTEFCVSHDIVKSKPKVGFDDPASDLNFTTEYIKKAQEKR